MKSAIIVRTEAFTLTSYGNGLSYVLYNRHEEKSFCVSGDDANQFREEWEAFENAKPDWTHHQIMSELWGTYSELAEPDERAGDM